MVDVQIEKKIRIAFVFRIRDAGFGFLTDRHQPHQPHQTPDTPDPRSIDRQSRTVAHLTHPEEGVLHKNPVDFPHQGQIVCGFPFGLIVQAGTGYAQECALTDNTGLVMLWLGHSLPAGDAHRFPQALAKKSRSTVSCPIFACNSRSSFFWMHLSGFHRQIFPPLIP